MKTIITAAALVMGITAGAFAQDSTTAPANSSARADLDAAVTDPTIWDMMMDSEGMDVDDATYQSNWDGATPEQRTAMKDACIQARTAKAEMSPAATDRCDAAIGS